MAGRYVECNKAFGSLLDKHPTEIIGKTDYDLFDKDIADLFKQKDKEMMDKNERVINEEWVTYPDGKRILLETMKFPFISEKGETVGIVGLSRDITIRKQHEEDILEANRKQANEAILKKAYTKMRKQNTEVKARKEELEGLNEKYLSRQTILQDAATKAKMDKKQFAEQKIALDKCQQTVKELQAKLNEKNTD